MWRNGYKNKTIRMLFAGGVTGQCTYYLASQLKSLGYKYEIVHFELSKSAIEIAERIVKKYKIEHVKFIQGSLL